MTRIARLFLFLAFGLGLPASVQAQSAVWWTDYDVNGNVIQSALTAAGISGIKATSQADFNAKVLSGAYNLAIYGEQNGGTFGGSSAALNTFLANGGRLVGASWLSSPMAQFFGAATASRNGTQITGSGELFAGVSGNISLHNPGWGTFSQGYNPGTGTCLATFTIGGCAAVLSSDANRLLLGPLFDTYGAVGTLDYDNGTQFVANSFKMMSTTTTPEPGSLILLATGLVGTVAIARRRKVQG